MAHDPLCRGRYQLITPVEHCTDCDLITAVREDERSNNFTPDDHADAMTQARAAALRDAASAADNQRSKFKARDWDDAIHAAIAAIEALGGKR